MNNYLPNGSVLPFGLLGSDYESSIAGFNKTYRNSALRLGVVVKSYDVSNESNITKLTTEYDVSIFEQMEDRGSTIITYRNCISAEGMGSIADFFERTLRVKQSSSENDKAITDVRNQNGAVVLVLCLDSVTEKAIIVGSITHPDRRTNLEGKTKYLEGEFNGVNIKVDEDGSATFTFNSPTDNDGEQIDKSITPTTVSVSSDGSFQIQHSTITLSLAKSGVVTLTSTDNLNISCKDANVQSSGDVNITAAGTATVEAPAVKLGEGAAEAVVKGDTFKKLFDTHTHAYDDAGSPSVTQPPLMPLSPSALSTKVKTE